MAGFGSNYYPVETPAFQQLESGDYTVRIKGVELKSYPSGDDYADITVEIKGFPGYKPDHIALNSAPTLGAMKNNGQQVTKEDVDRGNAKITRFFKAFGIQDGNFNILQWKGHIGTVHCDWQYDSKEPDHKSKQYKQLFPKVTEEKAAKTPAPALVQAVSKTMGGTAKKEEFPEDIPF